MLDDASEAAAAVLTSHLLSHLMSYRGSLQLAIEATDNGWLPAEDDPRIEVLARFIAGEARLPDDAFPLRVGLIVPGLQRGVHPPLLVLSESRGGLSKPRLAEAAGQVMRLKAALAIGHALRPALSSNQERAARELFALLPERRADLRAAEVDAYVRLTPSDVTGLANAGLELLESRVEEVRTIGSNLLQRLATFRFEPLGQEVLRALVRRGLLWPASIYRDAPEGIVDELLRLLERPNPGVSINHLLSALAWTRSTKARAAFLEWEKSPPPWAPQLVAPARDYLQTAAWSLDAEGNRRDLASAVCFQLLPQGKTGANGTKCFEKADKKCPACRTTLRWLFEFATVDLSRLGPAWAAAPKRVLACLVCAWSGAVFADYADNGASLHRPAVQGEKVRDDSLPGPLIRAVSSSPFPPFAAAESFSIEDASTLGGVPMWLQDAGYPRCPRCGVEMLFLAQFDNGSIEEEGIYYAFFCGGCRISAVTYQQT